jgi:membrane protease YdiL (CAAX protease family)
MADQPSKERASIVRVAGGFLLIFAAFDAVARVTGSVRGEWGAACLAAALGAALVVERLLFGVPPRAALRALGFAAPGRRGLAAFALAALPLLAFYPVFTAVTGRQVALRPGWVGTALGVFLQGGLGEELIWRGYLFRHLRAGRSFGRAATWTMVFMAVAHLPLFATLPPAVAGAALVISVIISFPMCHLFELDRGAVWTVALLHCLVQGLPKVVDVAPDGALAATMAWAGAAVLAPLVVFAFRRRPPG